MPNTFLPTDDFSLLTWLQQFTTLAQEHLGEIGLTEADLAPCIAQMQTLQGSVQDAVAAQNQARAAFTAKRGARAAAVATTAHLAKRVQLAPGATDVLKELMGVPVPAPRRRAAPVFAPEDLRVTLEGVGRARLVWNRGANTAGALFQVDALRGNATDWQPICTLTATRVTDANAVPGETVYYRVRALRGGRISAASNCAVLYGP